MSKLNKPEVLWKVVTNEYGETVDWSGKLHETEEAAWEEADADHLVIDKQVRPVVRCDFDCENCREYDWEDDLCKFSMAAARTEFFKEDGKGGE